MRESCMSGSERGMGRNPHTYSPNHPNRPLFPMDEEDMRYYNDTRLPVCEAHGDLASAKAEVQ